MGMEWTMKLGDKEYYMDSPLEHFMLLLKSLITMAVPYNSFFESAAVHDTSNAAKTTGTYYIGSGYPNYNWFQNAQPPAGTDAYGIQVGSNNTAVDILDYKLNTKISNGVAAGNLQYGTQTNAYGGAGANKWAKIMRTFTNNSGNDVIVKEAGLVINGYGPAYILITRDVIGDPGITIVNTDSMPVEIYIRTTA